MNKKELLQHLKSLSEMSSKSGAENRGLEQWRNRLKTWTSSDPKEKPVKTIKGRTDVPPRSSSRRNESKRPRPGT